MIIRIWEGTTTLENASAYEKLLKEEVFPGIAGMNVYGYKGIQLLRKGAKEEISFMTIMRFENWQAVRDFAGDDYERSYVIEKAKALLKNYDRVARHFEVLYDGL